MAYQISTYDQEELVREFTPEMAIVFCILDRQVPYPKVVDTYNLLKKLGLNTRVGLSTVTTEELAQILRSIGYRFPNQTAKFLTLFSENPIDHIEDCSHRG